jgi:hypothetical protein
MQLLVNEPFLYHTKFNEAVRQLDSLEKMTPIKKKKEKTTSKPVK